MLIYVYAGTFHADVGVGGTAGERCDRLGEPVDADYVCLGRTCDVRVGIVWVWRVCGRVGDAGATGMEVVKRRAARMDLRDTHST